MTRMDAVAGNAVQKVENGRRSEGRDLSVLSSIKTTHRWSFPEHSYVIFVRKHN